MTVTLEQLRKLSAELSRDAIMPLKVMDEAQAKRMTADDPLGHVWTVGEEYYHIIFDCGESGK